ncbi:alkaline phosphatase family protein [Aquimarina hainanensis]|uniref:Alkaline phosphatase family protein n=1 Tax=Aquimarina hainanensis TaxID=1578017 RepID=A0ABW5N5N0_9FLAO
MKYNLKHILLTGVLLCVGLSGRSQEKSELKIVLITLDGLRWQELYSGADPKLITNKEYVNDTIGLKKEFWRSDEVERRKVLMPFFWNTIEAIGQLHGNRKEGSKVNLTNSMWFSYPGYNEILTGVADDARIHSNNKIDNPNRTVLEFINNSRKYKGKVAAFGSWDVFPFIINEKRSGIPVNAGFEPATTNLTSREKFLNELQEQIPSPWSSVRLDAFTHHYALEYMKKKHPQLTYIAYGETDDFAHDGDYEAYLKAAHNTDEMIKQLWEYTQEDSFYKDQTIFIITTDHGRGTTPINTWRSHGKNIVGAGDVWLVAFGKGVAQLGEVTDEEQLYSNQIASTIAVLLQEVYTIEKAGSPINVLSNK